jgi:shikimate dehydrogenase
MDRYYVIGNPVAHSKSPQIHASFAAQTGQALSYEAWLAPVDGFGATVRALMAQGARGANVTVPFKLEACALAPTLSARARAAGAVNTLSFVDGAILGDNTDGAGLVTDIVHNAGVPIEGKRVLVLGAGGAARGVLLPILQEHPRQLVIANRTAATAHGVAQQFSAPGQPQQVFACALEDLAGPFDIVINATSASLRAELPPIPPAVFGPGTLALDLMYGSAPTVFMQFAARHGAQARDGLGMLVEQAAEAFLVWRGVRPATAALLATLAQSNAHA